MLDRFSGDLDHLSPTVLMGDRLAWKRDDRIQLPSDFIA